LRLPVPKLRNKPLTVLLKHGHNKSQKAMGLGRLALDRFVSEHGQGEIPDLKTRG
jgi:hypothetical protein